MIAVVRATKRTGFAQCVHMYGACAAASSDGPAEGVQAGRVGPGLYVHRPEVLDRTHLL